MKMKTQLCTYMQPPVSLRRAEGTLVNLALKGRANGREREGKREGKGGQTGGKGRANDARIAKIVRKGRLPWILGAIIINSLQMLQAGHSFLPFGAPQ